MGDEYVDELIEDTFELETKENNSIDGKNHSNIENIATNKTNSNEIVNITENNTTIQYDFDISKYNESVFLDDENTSLKINNFSFQSSNDFLLINDSNSSFVLKILNKTNKETVAKIYILNINELMINELYSNLETRHLSNFTVEKTRSLDGSNLAFIYLNNNNTLVIETKEDNEELFNEILSSLELK